MRACMKQVEDLLKSKIQCIWIETFEEEQVINDLKEILKKEFTGMELNVWSHTEGLKTIPLINFEQQQPADERMAQPRMLFKAIREAQEDSVTKRQAIWVLRDLHLLNDSHEVKRAIRDIKEYRTMKNYNPIVVISPATKVPQEHEKLFTLVSYDVPSKTEISAIVHQVSRAIEIAINEKGRDYRLPTEEDQNRLINACLGLTYNEIHDVLTKSLVKYKELSLAAIMEEKIQLVKKSGVLDYIVPQFTIDDFGGNHAFKDWILEVCESYSDEAKEFGIPTPKGYMSLGIPGTGKTMMAESLAHMRGIPLLSLDLSRIAL